MKHLLILFRMLLLQPGTFCVLAAGVYQRGGGRFLLVAILVRVIVPVLWKTAPATASSTKKH